MVPRTGRVVTFGALALLQGAPRVHAFVFNWNIGGGNIDPAEGPLSCSQCMDRTFTCADRFSTDCRGCEFVDGSPNDGDQYRTGCTWQRLNGGEDEHFCYAEKRSGAVGCLGGVEHGGREFTDEEEARLKRERDEGIAAAIIGGIIAAVICCGVPICCCVLITMGIIHGPCSKPETRTIVVQGQQQQPTTIVRQRPQPPPTINVINNVPGQVPQPAMQPVMQPVMVQQPGLMMPGAAQPQMYQPQPQMVAMQPMMVPQA